MRMLHFQISNSDNFVGAFGFHWFILLNYQVLKAFLVFTNFKLYDMRKLLVLQEIMREFVKYLYVP